MKQVFPVSGSRARRLFLAVLISLPACAPAAQEPRADSARPTPGRPANVARIAGTVATPAGQPVAIARVIISWTYGERVGSEACSPLGNQRFADTVYTNASGYYQAVLEGGVGPAFVGCVDAFAIARGLIATPLSPRPVEFTSAAAPQPVPLDITMTPEGAPPRPPTEARIPADPGLAEARAALPEPRPIDALPPPAPTAGQRIADWQRRHPTDPMPVSISFAGLIGDDAFFALLRRAAATPYAIHTRVAGLTGGFRVPLTMAGDDAVQQARRSAIAMARMGVCSNAARMESWATEPPARWPEPAMLAQARAMIAQRDAALAAIPSLEQGAPIIYGAEVLVDPAAIAALTRERHLTRVEPAAYVTIQGAERVVVPQAAVPPALDAPPPIPAALEQLGPDALLARMRAIAAEPRPDCERPGGPPPSPPQPPDTLPPRRPEEAQPLRPTIPPAVHVVFSLSGTASGSFRPGEPVELSARVDARATVDSVELTLTLPELADARRTGWGETFQRLGIGEPYPPLESLLVRMQPETPLLLRSHVVFDAPGWYMVSMVVRARSRPVTAQPLPTVEEAFRSFWIWIDEAGGFVADELDPTRYPLATEATGGPVRTTVRDSRTRADIEAGRAAPVTRARIEGEVRDERGLAVVGAHVTARAYMERCPGRDAAENVTHTNADGSFALDLGAAFEESFVACVVLHVDPPAGSGLARATVRTALRFLRASASPHRVAVTLATMPGPPADPAAGLALPPPVHATARATARRVIVETSRASLTTPGSADRVELSADVETDAHGRPIWEDGHHWRAMVRTAAHGDFLIFDGFLPHGRIDARIEQRAIDVRGSPPALVLKILGPAFTEVRRLRFDRASQAFVTESIVRVAWED